MDYKTILLTGSEGYIGSMLKPVLDNAGYKVIPFDKVFDDDILDWQDLVYASKEADLIIHLAAIVGLETYDKEPLLSREINILGTSNVVNCGKRVIMASVTGNYKNHNGIITEETEVDPKHDYFKSKIEAEKKVLEARSDNIVLRFGSLYGISKNMRWDLLVHNLCLDAYKNGEIELYQPYNKRALTSIDDATRAIAFISSNGFSGGIYNVVSCNISKLDIVNNINKIWNINIVMNDKKDVENRDYVVSSKKMQSYGFIFSPEIERNLMEIIRKAQNG